MFNSTHTLVGLALARTGLDRWNRHAAVTAAIAANLPDIDIVTGLYGMPAYIDYHRGITHAIAAIPLLSLVLAAAMYKFSGNFSRTFVVALLAMSTHPLLDYMNTYGVRPFLPFDDTWFYGDALFVIDPSLDFILLAALAAGRFRKMSCGALALAGLAAAALYVGARIELRNLSRSYVNIYPRASVSPHSINPFRWTGLIKDRGDVIVATIDPFQGFVGGRDVMQGSPPSKAIERASIAASAGAFLRFARFPVVRERALESGHEVTFLDMRYYNRDDHSGFAARIVLDSSLQIVEESLSFDQPID